MEVPIYVISYLFVFTMGFVGGVYVTKTNASSDKPRSFFDKQKEIEQERKHNAINIDDTKVVLDKHIATDSLEKKFDSLGKTKTSKDNTQSAISKLKNMKGK
jgi:hypothetical protein